LWDICHNPRTGPYRFPEVGRVLHAHPFVAVAGKARVVDIVGLDLLAGSEQLVRLQTLRGGGALAGFSFHLQRETAHGRVGKCVLHRAGAVGLPGHVNQKGVFSRRQVVELVSVRELGHVGHGRRQTIVGHLRRLKCSVLRFQCLDTRGLGLARLGFLLGSNGRFHSLSHLALDLVHVVISNNSIGDWLAPGRAIFANWRTFRDRYGFSFVYIRQA